MKKSILIVLGLLVLIALLPVVGNSFMQSRIDERVVQLETFGLTTSKDTTYSSYLNTSRHFEFLLKDTHKFLEYIKQYPNKQIPAYIERLLSDSLVGVDVEYSNLPFAKVFTIEIYPLSLSKEAQNFIASSDLEFSRFVEDFLKSKGILYHIEYNLLNDDFKGYIKDIDEKFTLKDEIALEIKLHNAVFKGNGKVLAPTKFDSKIKELYLNIKHDSSALHVSCEKFNTKSNFESKNSYLTTAEIKKAVLELSGTQSDINLSMEKLKQSSSSNDLGEKIKLNSKVSVKEIEYKSNDDSFLLNKLSLDIALRALDKKSYKELLNSFDEERELQNKGVELLSKGIILEIAEFSLKNIERENTQNLKGFNMNSKLTIKEDSALLQKVQLSPLLAISNINLMSRIELSKELYMELLNLQPFVAVLTPYAKELGDSYIFDMSFLDSQMLINGKSLN